MESCFAPISLEPSPPKAGHPPDEGASGGCANRNPRAKFLLEHLDDDHVTNVSPHQGEQARRKSSTTARTGGGGGGDDDDFDFDNMEVSAIHFDRSKVMGSNILGPRDDGEFDETSGDDGGYHRTHEVSGSLAQLVSRLDSMTVGGGTAAIATAAVRTAPNGDRVGASAANKNFHANILDQGNFAGHSDDPLAYLNEDSSAQVFGRATNLGDEIFFSGCDPIPHIEPLEGVFAASGIGSDFHRRQSKFSSRAPDRTAMELIDEVDREELNGTDNNFTTLLLKQKREELDKKRVEASAEFEEKHSQLVQVAMKKLGNADFTYRFKSGGKALFDHEHALAGKSVPVAPSQEEPESTALTEIAERSTSSADGDGGDGGRGRGRATGTTAYEASKAFMKSLFNQDDDDDDDDDGDVEKKDAKANVVAVGEIRNYNDNNNSSNNGNRNMSQKSAQNASQASVRTQNGRHVLFSDAGGAGGTSIAAAQQDQVIEFEAYARRLIKDSHVETLMVIRQCYQMMSFQHSQFAKKIANARSSATTPSTTTRRN